jgi:hypothetical protein
MQNRVAKLVRFSALVAAGGVLTFVVLSTNCGGSSGQRTGGAGTTGSGTGGAAGTSSTAGTTGTAGAAGVTGSGGAAGKFMCTPKPDLTCGASAVHLPDGHVTDFSMQEWTAMTGKWCNADGLTGSIFPYQGGPAPVDGGLMSASDRAVDAPAGNFRLTLTAGSAGYAGGGLSFDGCVDVTQFNAYRFTAWLASGDLKNCTFKAMLQTFEQRPIAPIQNPGGGCDPDAGMGSCYQFPTSPTIPLTATPQTFTFKFTDLVSSFTHVNPIAGQLVGLQWQLESGAPTEDGGAQTECMGEIRIDDISFVTAP